MAKLCRFFKGKKADANLIEKMSLKGYGKKFKDGNWLSRNEQNWENYKKFQKIFLLKNHYYYLNLPLLLTNKL